MTGKKNTPMRKDGDGSPAADASEWNKSKCSESILLELVKDGLLHDKDVVFWRAPELDLRPLENPGETTLFQHLTEHGLALPASNSGSSWLLWDSDPTSASQFHSSHLNFCSFLRSIFGDPAALESLPLSFPLEAPFGSKRTV